MRQLMGLVLAGALWMGTGHVANAQIWISSGNPYGAYGSGYYPTTYNAYAPGYGGFGMSTGTTYYSSGYAGYAAPAPYYATGYAAPTAYAYPTNRYSYGAYPGYGYRVRPRVFGRAMGPRYFGY